MAMNVGGSGEEQAVLNNINTTPLVDVMLVLLIIFLITIPVINKTVKVDLPKAVNIPTQTKPENITVAVDKDGNTYWERSQDSQQPGTAGEDQGGGRHQAAARGPHSRRQGRQVRVGRAGSVCNSTRRRGQSGIPHGARPWHGPAAHQLARAQE